MTIRQLRIVLVTLTMVGCIENKNQSNIDKVRADITTIQFPINNNSTREDIGQIVDKLDERCAIHFFDYYYEQISDPGAYVTIHKENGQLLYELANHGWSSDWKLIEKNTLIEYIYKNRQYNDGKIELRSRLKENGMKQTENGIVLMSYFYNIDDKKE